MIGCGEIELSLKLTLCPEGTDTRLVAFYSGDVINAAQFQKFKYFFHCKYFLSLVVFFLVIQHTVAVAFEIRICYLVTEFLAHAFGVLGHFQSAGTISAPCVESLFHRFNNVGIFV
jgi:hypothetical protein